MAWPLTCKWYIHLPVSDMVIYLTCQTKLHKQPDRQTNQQTNQQTNKPNQETKHARSKLGPVLTRRLPRHPPLVPHLASITSRGDATHRPHRSTLHTHLPPAAGHTTRAPLRPSPLLFHLLQGCAQPLLPGGLSE